MTVKVLWDGSEGAPFLGNYVVTTPIYPANISLGDLKKSK